MVSVLRNDDMGQQTWCGKAAFNRRRWCRCFDDSIAAHAGELRSDMSDDLEALGDVLQLLRNVFTKLSELTSAIPAAITLRSILDHFTFEMLGQRLALRPRLRSCHSFGTGLEFCFCRLFLFQHKLQLLEFKDDPLALGAEQQMTQLFDHQLHVLDPLSA